ncbi:MAG: ketopantoate reductase family protein [Spirochaeta sp.]|jgi:2-dehydropantoate 2-reductase|nr:ketopantoate reductase family protein [Spirochaeta sp.]
MRILIYGAGVIGSIWAGKLAGIGIDVTVLARGQRYHEILDSGIILRGAYDLRNERYQVKVIEELQENDLYDYIVVTVQKTQVDSVLPVVAKNRSERIVCMVNNASGYETWAETLGEESLMVGFLSAGGERQDGVVEYFIGRGAIRCFQTTTFGEYSGAKTARLAELIGLFRRAGIPAVGTSDMDGWQKTHVAIVTAIANALYKHQCDTYRLASSQADVKLMLDAVQEGLLVLKRLGHRLTPSKLWYMNLPTPVLVPIWRVFLNTKMAETAIARHTRVARSEMQQLQREFDTHISLSGVATPAIDQLRPYLFS